MYFSQTCNKKHYRYNSGPVIDYEIPHTTRCQKLPFYYAATQWNSLSPEMTTLRILIKPSYLNNTIWNILIPSDNEYCNTTKMDFVNITLVPLNMFKVSKFTIKSHSIKNKILILTTLYYSLVSIKIYCVKLVSLLIIPLCSSITAVIQPEGYNRYSCVSQIMEQDCTATILVLTLFQYE